MRNFQLISAVAAAAFAVVASASGAMAQAAKPAAPAAAAKPAAAAAKPASNVVTGKIVSIDAGLSMVTLADGKTYRITEAAKFKALKVGGTVNLVLPTAAKA